MENINANFNGKKIVKIYGGAQLLWEVPTVMFEMQQPWAGQRVILGTTYPGRCKIKFIKVGGKTYKDVSSETGLFSITLEEPLKDGDNIIISFGKHGWQDSRVYFKIS